MSNPPKPGIFGWFSGGGAPGGASGGPAPSGSAISDEPLDPLAREIPKRSRPRKDSSRLTHDEALNISRANSTRSQEVAGSPLSPELGPQRGRSNSRYDKLGLMAAYSAGPSSF